MMEGLRLGDSVFLPCRHCLYALPFTVKEGFHTLMCPKCDKQTQVLGEVRRGEAMVFTSRVGPEKNAQAPRRKPD